MYVNATLVTTSVFLGLAFISLMLRCYTRFVITRSFGIDDVCVFVSYLSTVGLTFYVVRGTQYGSEIQYLSELDPLQKQEKLRFFWAAAICFTVGAACVKNSAILQCLRFILYGRMRIFCWAFLAFTTALGFTVIGLIVFQCHPISAYWVLDIPRDRCLNLSTFYSVGSVGVVLMTMTVVAIPIITVKDLMMPRRQKIALMSVFAIGGFACIVSIVRIVYIHAVQNDKDSAAANAAAAIWASLELNTEIICVCIPPLKPLIVKIMPSLFKSPNAVASDVDTIGSGLSGVTLGASACQQRKDSLFFITSSPTTSEETLPARKENVSPV